MATETLSFATVAPPLLLSLVAVCALVICDFRELRPGRYIFKPLAAAAFMWMALSLGATQSTFGQWLLAGLGLCLLGDLFLMPDDRRSFLAGLVAFLCGHLLYAVAFVQLPSHPTGLIVSALVALPVMGLVLRWLLPHVEAPMKLPVLFYVLVITTMLLTSGLPSGHSAFPWIVAGAWGFAASDIAVARQRFVAPGRANRSWGTPLYFFSQMILATSVAWV